MSSKWTKLGILATTLPLLLFGEPFHSLSDSIPEWLKRIDLNWQIQEGFKPEYTIETIQPLYRTHETWRHTLFAQGRYAYRIGPQSSLLPGYGTQSTTNVGFGYRYLTPEETALFGVNTFYDLLWPHTHQRLGLGAEVLSSYAYARFNSYIALTGRKTVNSELGIQQKALSGFDFEGELPVPFFPWMRAAGQFYYYLGDQLANVCGGRGILRMNLTDFLTVEMGVDHNNYQNNSFVLFDFHLGRPQRIQYTLLRDPFVKGVAKQSVKHLTLEKVRRQNDLVIEQVGGVNGAQSNIIQIGRGT